MLHSSLTTLRLKLMLSSTFLSSVQISRDYLVSIVGLLPKNWMLRFMESLWIAWRKGSSQIMFPMCLPLAHSQVSFVKLGSHSVFSMLSSSLNNYEKEKPVINIKFCYCSWTTMIITDLSLSLDGIFFP